MNIYSYLKRINTNIKKCNYQYLYVDLNIFDCQHLSLEKYNKIKQYLKECFSLIEINNSKYIILIKHFSIHDISNKDEQSQMIKNTSNEPYLNKIELFLLSLLHNTQKKNRCFILNIIENSNLLQFHLEQNINNKIYYIKETLTSDHISKLNISQSYIGLSWNDFIHSQYTVNKSQHKHNSNKDYNFSSVCNMNNIKESISDMLTLSTKYKDLFKNKSIPLQLSKGCLLIGPSGCGKSYIAKAIKSEFNISYMSIKATDILGKYIGQSESAIREIFLKAKEKAPCVLFIDNIEALTPVRGSSNGINDRIVNQFLTYLD